MKLVYKEVLGYSNVPPAQRSVWLSRRDWRKLFTSKRAVGMFLIYRLVLLLTILASVFILRVPMLSVAVILMSICFMVVMDRELVNYAHKRRALCSESSQIRKLVSEEVDGWYTDPFTTGKVGVERYYEKGIWTYHTRKGL